MPFDKKKAADYARQKAMPPFGNGHCAVYVREALEKGGGLNTAGHPVPAKDWGTTLIRIGFQTVANTHYCPQIGDIIILQNIKGHPYGHIELYDGKNWISDFVQSDMWPSRPYQTAKATYQIYRYSS